MCMYILEEGGSGEEEHTAIQVRLLSQLVVRVAVGVNRAIQLLECHERRDELVVGVEQAAEPLL